MARQEGDRFIPLAFAARTGAWGQAAKNLWKEMMTMAKAKGIGADLWGWNAMTWARHWKQRVGVELARGRARLVRAQMRTVESGEADDQGTTQEFHASLEEDSPGPASAAAAIGCVCLLLIMFRLRPSLLFAFRHPGAEPLRSHLRFLLIVISRADPGLSMYLRKEAGLDWPFVRKDNSFLR